ncbi:radical SAM protein [Paenibacillus sp. CMAA1739]|uniref:radical SAM/SPASM domain-containing protein n=1 Tax=Paenibacillus ottowii TaxID=2315729 RepID=UPI00273072A2|nr:MULTISPECIES: radical SAM protein [Paenibacillus]MDP1510553.1 radical SAM protein [Paenibacillus ottowii]MEC4565967.1 radical SAM protein [Paenibacillus sp. CMAA1739]
MSTTDILLDPANILKGPHQIAFDITNKCNLRCLHCYNNSGDNIVSTNELSDSEVMDFIEDVGKMELFNFCFCGGETLLRKDLICKASSRLKSLGVANISMVTNALLLNERTIMQLKENGVNRIQVSLDGSKADSHDRLRNKKGVFDKAILAINLLKKLDVKCSVAFTPTCFNVDEIEEVHSILSKIGIDGELRVQPLMLLGRADGNESSINVSKMQYRQLVKEINRINNQNTSLEIKWGDPIDHLIRFRTTSSSQCVNHCNVRANGDIVVSAYLPLVVGNLRNHSFSEYWNSGLGKVWENKIPSVIAKTIVCIEDMNKRNDGIPTVWRDKDIYIDMIDKDLNDISNLK